MEEEVKMILYQMKNKASEQGYAQPGAPPYVSPFRTLLALIQKQEVDCFGPYMTLLNIL